MQVKGQDKNSHQKARMKCKVTISHVRNWRIIFISLQSFHHLPLRRRMRGGHVKIYIVSFWKFTNVNILSLRVSKFTYIICCWLLFDPNSFIYRTFDRNGLNTTRFATFLIGALFSRSETKLSQRMTTSAEHVL